MISEELKAIGSRFEILGLLGEGGFGAVYKAYDHDLDRTVALKVMHPHLSQDASASERFIQEARLCADVLCHPNIVRVFSAMTLADGRLLMVMEYVDAIDFDVYVALHVADWSLVIRLAIDVLGALEHAHVQGILHRDIKPANILVCQSSDSQAQPKLTDFGLAKYLPSQQKLTATGLVTGTPEYMSPEQNVNEELDTRSDLYSLGCVIYEALTGRPLSESDDIVEVRLSHFSQLPEPIAGVPRAVDLAVRKAMEKNPEDRYGSAAEFADVLRRVLDNPDRLPLRVTEPSQRTYQRHQKKIPLRTMKGSRAFFGLPVGTGVFFHSKSAAWATIVCAGAIMLCCAVVWARQHRALWGMPTDSRLDGTPTHICQTYLVEHKRDSYQLCAPPLLNYLVRLEHSTDSKAGVADIYKFLLNKIRDDERNRSMNLASFLDFADRHAEQLDLTIIIDALSSCDDLVKTTLPDKNAVDAASSILKRHLSENHSQDAENDGQYAFYVAYQYQKLNEKKESAHWFREVFAIWGHRFLVRRSLAICACFQFDRLPDDRVSLAHQLLDDIRQSSNTDELHRLATDTVGDKQETIAGKLESLLVQVSDANGKAQFDRELVGFCRTMASCSPTREREFDFLCRATQLANRAGDSKQLAECARMAIAVAHEAGIRDKRLAIVQNDLKLLQHQPR